VADDSGGWIIEHPTRGVLTSQVYDEALGWRRTYSPGAGFAGGTRHDTLKAVRKALGRLRAKERREVNVRRWGSWVLVSDLKAEAAERNVPTP
jgi:hypothetical protein